MSTAAEFLSAASKRRYVPLQLPSEWQLDGYVRSLTEKERSDYEASLLDNRQRVSRSKLKEAKARLIVLSVVDSEHNPVFSPEHLPGLMRADSKLIDTVYAQVTKHIGFDADELNELAAGNGSPSGSGSDAT